MHKRWPQHLRMGTAIMKENTRTYGRKSEYGKKYNGHWMVWYGWINGHWMVWYGWINSSMTFRWSNGIKQGGELPHGWINSSMTFRWSNGIKQGGELSHGWINSSMTFRWSNGIKQGGELSPFLYNVYADDLNRHLQATGVGCYVGVPGIIHRVMRMIWCSLHPR